MYRFGDNSRTISSEERPKPKKKREKERGHTVYKFLSDLNSKTGDSPSETHRSKCPKPTSQQP